MKPKQKVILGLSIFFIAALIIVAYGFYAESTAIYDFGEFSIKAPRNCEFEDVTYQYSSDPNMGSVYRCKNIDLTITSFNKQYVESSYRANTGDNIDFSKEVLQDIISVSDPQINRISDTTTLFISNTRVNGQIDCDVAGVYEDDGHLIIVEGGDIEFIENITKSIEINDNYNK